KGQIYKTNNMLGESLAKICGNDSTKLSAEQKRIEAELKEFETHIWGKPEVLDSLDSLGLADDAVKTKKVRTKEAKAPRTKTARSRSTKEKSSKSSSLARISVRRERR
ncbi:MAG: gliding motility protein GldN, partial [Prevotella sp.]|nr:gliding motility protein GldN [Prevotella sp.]